MSANNAGPLRDRLLSNSPDPVKLSILRESGLGRSASSPPPSSSASINPVTPLRIAKRESPHRNTGADIARRSSSSYKHVRNNNLVSKSPFKSLIPTPTTTPLPFPGSPRRVSGEKRTRPLSMTEQAENERPFAFKRERRQSKGFQGLIQKEPVTKSPFKRLPSSEDNPLLPLLPTPASRKPIPVFTVSEHMPSHHPGTSPPRSSLVSRRMHGPRSFSGNGSLNGRRRRRKTVTFDERCDVVEFDREEEMEEAFVSDEDDYGEDEDDDFFLRQPGPGPDDSYESVPLDGDESITGLVDAILRPPPPPSTPPHDISLGLGAGTAGQPGKTYHTEHHPSPKSTPPASFPSHSSVPSPYAFSLPTHAEAHPPATPPRPSRPSTSPSTMQVPLGRSTHIERARAARMNDDPEWERELPESPSPMRIATTIATNVDRTADNEPVPRFGIHILRHSSSIIEDDPFALPQIKDERPLRARPSLPQIKDEHLPQIDDSYFSNGSHDPANLSIGHSDIPISGLGFHHYEKEPANDELDLGMGLDNLTEPPESTLNSSYSSFAESDRSVSSISPGGEDSKKVKPDVAEQLDESLSQSKDTGAPCTDSPALGSSIPTRITSPIPTLTSLPVLARLASPLLTRVGSPAYRTRSPLLHSSSASPLVNSPNASPLAKSSSASPIVQSHSGSSLTSNGSISGRQRISREYVQRRLMRKKSTEVIDERPVVAVEEEDKKRELEPHASTQEKDIKAREKKTESMSVTTDSTDHSVELATIETAEKKNVGLRPEIPDISQDLGMNLNFDFGSRFGRGLDMDASSGRIEQVDVDMDMRSALDRLMDDVAGNSTAAGPTPEKMTRHRTPEGNNSMVTDEEGESMRVTPDWAPEAPVWPGPVRMERASTDSVMLPGLGFVGPPMSRTASGSTIPPPPPPKDAIRSREEMILEKRREVRRREEEENMGYSTPPRNTVIGNTLNVEGGRPSRRRSMSTGDVELLSGAAKKRGALMRGEDGGLLEDVVPFDHQEDPLGDSIDRELRKLEGPSKNKYQIRERVEMIYASSDADRISHMASAGDVDGGKAWRAVRRPSDMNEYSKEIKEFRAQEKPGKAHGKVFVKVLGMKNMNLPMPQAPTVVTCTLNNGIHFVTTPECQLGRDFRIDQEFELIEHSKLEFTLTLKVRRDPHIISQFKAITPSHPPPPPPVAPAPSKGGMRSFFSSSPKKPKERIVTQPPPPPPTAPIPENLARYLKLDGTLARAFISFKDVGHRCDSRLFETSYPLIGQKTQIGSNGNALQVGEIMLQMFRLPPLPGIPPDQLPQSLEECHRGLRHVNWHKVTYFEGTLTQHGGDCSSWRRRQLRVIGANLVAFNDVTKKATVTIDLKKAIAVEDDQEIRVTTTRSRHTDDYDGLYGVERSFRLIFPHDQEIVFFADTDEEKTKWLEVLCALVGHIPPHPLWAELLWQRQEDPAKRVQTAGPSRGSRPASQPAPRAQRR